MSNKIERFGLADKVKEMREEGYPLSTIKKECNKLLPSKITISDSALSYYFRKIDKPKKSDFDIMDEDPGEKLKLLETKVWALYDDAEKLLLEARSHIKDNPELFGKSIRSANEVLKTCLLLIKEMKEPAQILNIDIKKQSINCLLDFTSDLPNDMKKCISEKAENYFLNDENNQ